MARRTIQEVNANNCREASLTYYIRIRVDDLATISNYLISNGFTAYSGGQVASRAVAMLSEYLIATNKSKRFDLQEAKKFCEGIGLAGGSRRNVRVIGSQFEEPSSPIVSNEEMEDLNRLVAKNLESMKAREVYTLPKEVEEFRASCPSEDSIPSDDNELLKQLEVGAIKVKEGLKDEQAG